MEEPKPAHSGSRLSLALRNKHPWEARLEMRIEEGARTLCWEGSQTGERATLFCVISGQSVPCNVSGSPSLCKEMPMVVVPI